MADSRFSEIEKFLSVFDSEADESAARVGKGKGEAATRPARGPREDATRAGRSGKGEMGQRPGRPGGGESGQRPGLPGNGKAMMTSIEEANEAGGRVAKSTTNINHEIVDSPGVNMLEILAQQQGMEYVDLGRVHIAEDVIELFPADFARDNKCLPIRFKEDGTLVVAIADPLNVTIADNLRLLLERPIEPVVSKEDDILDLIDKHFSHAEDIDQLIEDLRTEAGLGTGGSPTGSREFEIDPDPERAASSPPVIRLVNLILLRALKDRASDLHIEPFQSTIRVRYRVDGVLRELPPPPKSFQVGLITRFKVMADMNITESRRPQDGRIKLTLQGREIDLRVSSLPTVHGESIVIRVLDKQMMMIGIDQIGMTKKVLTQFRDITKRPNGVILVTGPTGSGKTTTLYAAVSDRLNPEEKFITTEDPVEYEMAGLVQVNINQKVGLTFASCLRAILRQDPDVLLVGEIRDMETAKISIEAALTGHLVFSTLHTNSAAATVTRLMDMGIEPFLLTSTLQVVIGQRLVRSICPTCRQPYQPSDGELAEFAVRTSDVRGFTFYHGAGCDECNQSGYRGRLGLFEMLVVDDDVRDLIIERATADEIHELSLSKGMMTMRQDGFLKICMGVTTFGEVSHHVASDTEEHVRREVDPLLKQLREKLGASGSFEDTDEREALPASSSGGIDSIGFGPVSGIPEAPPELTSIPGGLDLAGRPSPPPQPSTPLLGLPGLDDSFSLGDLPPLPRVQPGLGSLGDDDDLDFLSASSLQSHTPLAEMGESSSFEDLEESELEEDELDKLDLSDLTGPSTGEEGGRIDR